MIGAGAGARGWPRRSPASGCYGGRRCDSACCSRARSWRPMASSSQTRAPWVRSARRDLPATGPLGHRDQTPPAAMGRLCTACSAMDGLEQVPYAERLAQVRGASGSWSRGTAADQYASRGRRRFFPTAASPRSIPLSPPRWASLDGIGSAPAPKPPPPRACRRHQPGSPALSARRIVLRISSVSSTTRTRGSVGSPATCLPPGGNAITATSYKYLITENSGGGVSQHRAAPRIAGAGAADRLLAPYR